MRDNEVVSLGLDWNLLQSWRLAHAVMDAGWTVAFDAEQMPNLTYLSETAGFTVRAAYTPGTAVAAGVDHATPRTWLGQVERPLIFPQSIAERCRRYWSDRPLHFTFAGLLTPGRAQTLRAFARQISDRLPRLKGPGRLWGRFADENRAIIRRSIAKEIVVWISMRGRVFPYKLWDDEYYRTLGRSQFVLCPRGDHLWTYRFFEACLSGAIPVVAGEGHDSYRHFEFVNMADATRELEWSADVAEHNYRAANELLVIPIELIGDAIRHAPHQGRSRSGDSS